MDGVSQQNLLRNHLERKSTFRYTFCTMTANPNATMLNQALVDKLVADKQITSPCVEAAFRAVFRHHFVPNQPIDTVYQDRAIGTKTTQNSMVSSSSQPAMMAIMLEQLRLEPGHQVLEIGAGTGFNAALISHIVGSSGHVTTVDIDQDIVDQATSNLIQAGFPHVDTVCADGGYGWTPSSPYDRIILTVGAGDITPAWWEQLKPGGLLIIPLELGVGQFVIAFTKKGGKLVSHALHNCRFIRLRGAFASEICSQQIGSSGECSIISRPETASEIDVSMISDCLLKSYSSIMTDVVASPQDVWEGLVNWLLLREPKTSLFIAIGEAASQELLPALTTFQKSHFINTVGICSQHGMALVYHAKAESPYASSKKVYPIMIAQYQDSAMQMEHLRQLVQEWDRHGQPLATNMQVTALRGSDTPRPLHIASGSLRICKEYTDFHIQMSASDSLLVPHPDILEP